MHPFNLRNSLSNFFEADSNASGSPPSVSSISPKANTIANACFRTTSDGLIALAEDWPAFLENARLLGPVAMQTRHAAARMITLQTIPEFSWRPDGRWMSEAEGALHFSFGEWARAWGQLTPCECCGSFGRISVRNKLGCEFMQFSAVSESRLADWSTFLNATAAKNFAPAPLTEPEDVASSASASGSAQPDANAWTSKLPRVPGNVTWVSSNTEDLMNLLDVVQGENLPVRWTLRSVEFCNTRVFVPRHLNVIGGRVLSVRGECAQTIQLGLPMAEALAIDTNADDLPLHVTGPNGSRLLTLSAPGRLDESGLWRAILLSFFPQIAGD